MTLDQLINGEESQPFHEVNLGRLMQMNWKYRKKILIQDNKKIVQYRSSTIFLI